MFTFMKRRLVIAVQEAINLLFATAGIFAPSNYEGRTSAAYLPNGTEVNPEELRVATDNPLSTVTRVDHVDGIDYGYNSLGIEYQLVGDGPFYYVLEGGATNLGDPDPTNMDKSVQNVNEIIDDATSVFPGSMANSYLFSPSAFIRKTSLSVFGGITYTISFYCRSIGGTNIRTTWNDTAAWSTGDSVKHTLSSGWERYTHSFTKTASGVAHIMFGTVDAEGLNDVSCNAGRVLIDGIQIEAGSEATTFTSSIRTPDKVITEPNITPADNPQIRTIDSNGNVITEPVFGASNIINGDFSNGATSWNPGTTQWDLTGGNASLDGTQPAFQNLSTDTGGLSVNGRQFLLTFSISNFVSGTVRPNLGVWGSIQSGSGIKTDVITAADTGSKLLLQASDSFNGSVDDFSLRIIHPLCSYDPDTQILTVRVDTSVNTKLAIG